MCGASASARSEVNAATARMLCARQKISAGGCSCRADVPIKTAMAGTTHPFEDDGRHFGCSMPSVLVRRIRAQGGEEAVDELLRLSGSKRDAAYLEDPTN